MTVPDLVSEAFLLFSEEFCMCAQLGQQFREVNGTWWEEHALQTR